MSINKPLSILIVDDSVVFRSAVAAALDRQEDIRVAGSVRNGVKAMEFIQLIMENGELRIKNGESSEDAFSNLPDIITLDVEMPEMDGLATLNEIQRIKASFSPKFSIFNSKLSIIMLSAHTRKGAETTINALESGAFDFVTKPEGKNEEESIEALQLRLLPKIRILGSQRNKLRIDNGELTIKKGPKKISILNSQFSISKLPKAILIGVSTGGPNALKALLPELCRTTDLPIFVVQHMPPVFTKSLAEILDRACAHKVIESAGSEIAEKNYVYIAPGGKHMVLRKTVNGSTMLGLNENQPENGCRPSVDVLFRTAASIWGGDVVPIILTGMGNDGAKGMAALKRAGAYSIIQDEESSVVWGMPGSVVEAGLADEVVPLEGIANRVGRLLGTL